MQPKDNLGTICLPVFLQNTMAQATDSRQRKTNVTNRNGGYQLIQECIGSSHSVLIVMNARRNPSYNKSRKLHVASRWNPGRTAPLLYWMRRRLNGPEIDPGGGRTQTCWKYEPCDGYMRGHERTVVGQEFLSIFGVFTCVQTIRK